jgi:hypothetical protein
MRVLERDCCDGMDKENVHEWDEFLRPKLVDMYSDG